MNTKLPDPVNRPIIGMPLRAWRLAFGFCLLAVLALSLLPLGPEIPSTGWDKTNHLLAFSMLALLGCRAYRGRTLPVLASLLAYGALIEVLQSFTSYRFAEWGDLLADALGLVLGWGTGRLAMALVKRR